MKFKFVFIVSVIFILVGCGNYSFIGKSIPKHIGNAQLVLFDDLTSRYDLNIPDKLKEKITTYIDDYHLFDILNSTDTDAKISGTVNSYTESITSQISEDTADERVLKVVVTINFYDAIAKKYIIKKSKIELSENYHESDGEEGKNIAFEKLIDQLSENIVIKLSSNW